MLASELISNHIPPLKHDDTGDKALSWMSEFGVDHLPVVKDNKYIGLISEVDILDENNLDKEINTYRISDTKNHVYGHYHVFEVLKAAKEGSLTLIPVIDKDFNYTGLITYHSLFNYFSELSSISESGGIVILEMAPKDYLLSEIARMVEQNEANIVNMYVGSFTTDKMTVTLKINRTDLSHIIATFERYGYTIKNVFQESDYTDHLKERFDSFMNYLNI